MGLKATGIALTLLALPMAALAMPPKSMTRAEKALLPPYCQYAQGGHLGKEVQHAPSAGARHWMDVFGGGEATTNNHWKIHHYCYAQLHFMRANRAGAKPMQVKEHLSATVEEIDFTIEKVTPDFILLPEMLLYRGRALMRLGKEGEALASWEQAIKLKADYWPPYMEIANLRVRAGDRGKAAEVLRVALERSPGAKPVQERLRELESNR